MRNLLIVEDDRGLREQLKWAFCEAFDVREADTLDGALRAFREEGGGALVCLDMGLEGKADRGLDVLDALLAEDRACKVVALTASADESLGREAIRRGAFDYLRKPADPAALLLLFDRAKRIRELEAEPSWSPAPGPLAADDGPEASTALLGESEAVRRVRSAIARLASAGADVLFTGEPGSGREAAARALHARGARKDGPFVTAVCAGIPEEILECDLFGCVKGAFPGAEEDRGGLLEAASGGTLYLDGLDAMPLSLQARLLRFLSDGVLQRVGAPRPVAPEERPPTGIMASASRFAGASFRSDLLRRLGEFEVAMPALRERGRDALIIAQALVERNRERFDLPRLRLSARAEKLILAHAWPGNVRELESRVNRAAVACQGQVIEEADLEVGEGAPASLNYREQRKAFERNLLINALRRTNGNVSLAARTMGVTRPTFYDMMKKSGVSLRLEPRL